MEIGTLIHRELKKREKTQQWLAKEVGISRTAVSQVVTGRYNPNPRHLKKILEALNVEMVCYFIDKDNHEKLI